MTCVKFGASQTNPTSNANEEGSPQISLFVVVRFGLVQAQSVPRNVGKAVGEKLHRTARSVSLKHMYSITLFSFYWKES